MQYQHVTLLCSCSELEQSNVTQKVCVCVSVPQYNLKTMESMNLK